MTLNYPSDFDTPFGKIVTVSGQNVIASCRFCKFAKMTRGDEKKRWSSAARARMGLQLHAIHDHRELPEVKQYIR